MTDEQDRVNSESAAAAALAGQPESERTLLIVDDD
jgi:hypothetical protein